MNIKELKEFLDTLPKEFDSYDLVNGEFAILENTGYNYRLDKPIECITVDEDSKEILFCHQTQEEIDKIQTE